MSTVHVVVEVIVRYFSKSHFDHRIAALVEARQPWKLECCGLSEEIDTLVDSIHSVATLSRAVSRIQADGRGLPALLKHYLLLGGESIGFNVDPDFENVVDYFLQVDLVNADQSRLKR